MFKMIGALGAAWLFATGATAENATCILTAPDASAAGRGCENAWIDANLKLNELVAVGTHNSYKSAMPDAVMDVIRRGASNLAEEIDYRHRPIPEQLDAGIRQLEIDIYHDPEGGRFLNPAALRAASVELDPDRRAALAEPGFKVMHIQDVDIFSSCTALKTCLGIIRNWSRAHPNHAPILIMVNVKTDPAPVPGGVDALPFDAAAFDALDSAVKDAIPSDALITPDDVQGAHPTLRDAVLAGSWPKLGDARGKLMFALDEGPEKVAVYRGNRRSLEGRVFFVNTDESSPAAAYLTINDPLADGDRIRRAVEAGFIVRTRADAATIEARRNDRRRYEAALASGAQFISTDYFWPEPKLSNGYRVRLPAGEAARCNPVRGSERCAGYPLEAIATAR